MKQLFTLLALWSLALAGFAQSVGIGTTTPDASAALEVKSTTRGLLPPRLSAVERAAIQNPAVGLTIFNTTTGLLNVWDGGAWVAYLADLPAPTVGATSFGYTGGAQTYVVPSGVVRLRVDMAGAAGGDYNNFSNTPGGKGGRIQALLTVVPGETLYLNVGGGGGGGNSAGGYNGGGHAGNVLTGSGGGATDIRRGGTALSNRVLVAGGGGGARSGAPGGCGGGLQACDGAVFNGQTPAGGGSQTSGGAGGVGSAGSTYTGGAGGLGFGGSGNTLGGGGGGGYYGGGGGGIAGGGGGSSYADAATASSVVHTQGYQSSHGFAILTPALPAPALDATNFVNVPGDNLGNHTATQNLNLGSNALVGNGGSTGLSIGSTGAVGIGAAATSNYRTDVKTAAAAENGLLVRLTGASTAQSLKLEHNGSNLIVRPATAGGAATVVENTGSGGSLLLNPAGGNVGIGTTSADAKLEVDGFTKLGSNGPAIKTLELSGTFGITQGQVLVAHGLPSDAKILSVTALTTIGPDQIPPGFSMNAGVLYGVYIYNGNVVLQTGNTGNSSGVYGKTARILIIYKE